MRIMPVLCVSALIATPAAAQQPVGPSPAETAQIQRALTDPAIADKLTAMLPALGNALLNMPVGEIQAAVEGRPASRADRKTTVRDLGRRDDPSFERNLKADLANGGAAMKAGMSAMAAALPAMIQGLSKAAEAMEKATANLPSPTYPKQ